MKFALFYEIPVARPWGERSEYDAYHNTLTQAIAADQLGWHAFWTVEHHFLEEFSHCSNPEVLYGAVAASTKNLRIGYGVRLMPKPYNHPVRTAESIAVLDLLSSGRVDFGAGRSATRAELEGFGIDPHETRSMWREAIGRIIGCWTNDEYEFDGPTWSMPKRRVLPKPWQKPHPPVWGATTSDEGHAEVGDLGIGLCSFAVGVPPDEIGRKIKIYREHVAGCAQPLGATVHNAAATFTMMNVAPTASEARDVARASFEWYPKVGPRRIATVAEYMADRNQELGNYSYAADMKAHADDGSLDLLSLDILLDMNACVCGTPDDAVAMCKRYEAAGVDLLLCLVNPYKIPHDKVMQTIQLVGRHVIPQFAYAAVVDECLVVTVTVGDAELVAHRLWELGAVAIAEEPSAGSITLTAGFETAAVLHRAAAETPGAQVVLSENHDDDWRRYATVTRVSERLAIRPLWVDYDAQPGEIVVDIDPERVFGAGDHATTRLVLEVLEATIRGGERVLDVGCGSGVLSIAAVRLGASSALALDVDTSAMRTTHANPRRNGVADRVGAVTTPLVEVTRQFEVVVANLGGTEVVVELAPLLTDRVALGGLLVVSGVLDEAAGPARDALAGAARAALAGAHDIDERRRDGWMCFVIRRS